jgi:hypothetical protein
LIFGTLNPPHAPPVSLDQAFGLKFLVFSRGSQRRAP